MASVTNAFADGMTVARRNVTKVRRVPEILVGALVQPLLMIVVFGYVFGGAIDIPGDSYREFLIGGVFALTLTFGASFTAAGLADDMQKGVMDRFRSLPMSRSAVVVGRTASDLVLTTISLVVMGLAGLAVGWRVPNGIDGALAGFGLLLLYAYALSWVMAYIAQLVRSVEVVNNAALVLLFPLTFRGQHPRAQRDHARLAANHRRVEPGLGRHPSRTRALRKHPCRDPRTNCMVSAEPDRLHPRMGRRTACCVRPPRCTTLRRIAHRSTIDTRDLNRPGPAQHAVTKHGRRTTATIGTVSATPVAPDLSDANLRLDRCQTLVRISYRTPLVDRWAHV